ncbi:MAG: hypothetical protein ACLQVI_36540 [Polyangiaceae bacterium]
MAGGERRVAWAKGGEAVVVRLEGDSITLRSSIPSPPGSRIEGALAGPDDSDAVRVKVHSSKRQEDGSFVLEGRVLDMTRAVREKLTP